VKNKKKEKLARLSFHMSQAEKSINGLIYEVEQDGPLTIGQKRRILKIKQALLSLKVEYNNIKLKYEK